jgi:hypothetical protein
MTASHASNHLKIPILISELATSSLPHVFFLLNHRLSQKLKLIGKSEINNLINILILPSYVGSNSPSINETQYVECLTEKFE